jgi:predicted nucleotidyltransferase
MSIMLSESIKNELIENLQIIDPAKVILFGSYAYGSPNQDSDIDLYIVTKENFIPASYEENLQIKKRGYQALGKFRKKYASDILVHTLPVHQKFIELGSSFSKEIMQKGIVLM